MTDNKNHRDTKVWGTWALCYLTAECNNRRKFHMTRPFAQRDVVSNDVQVQHTICTSHDSLPA